MFPKRKGGLTMKKRLLSVLTASIMTITVMPLCANAEDDVTATNKTPNLWHRNGAIQRLRGDQGFRSFQDTSQ